jgi:hypothetical protein
MKINNWEILKASRSECNESEGKEMAGCLADGDRVIVYFPTVSAMRHAELIAAAPRLLNALIAIKTQAELTALTFPNAPGRVDLLTIARIASDEIAKAEGKA